MRKIGAILVMIVSAIGFLLCVGLLVGAWIFNEPATDAVTSTLDMADEYLTLVDQTIMQVDMRLAEIQSALDSLATTSPETVAQAQETVAQKVEPVLSQVNTALDTLDRGIQAVNQSLEKIGRIPGIDTPSFSDELQGVEQSLSAINTQVDELTANLAGADFNGEKVAASASAISGKIAEVRTALASWKGRIDTTSATTATAKSAMPSFIDNTSILCTLLSVLLGAGQVALFMVGLNWFRPRPTTMADTWKPLD